MRDSWRFPLIAGIPFGFFTYPAIFANLLFAAGAGAVLFIMVKIAANVEYERNTRNLILGFVVGFLLVYLGSLIHFAEIPAS